MKAGGTHHQTLPPSDNIFGPPLPSHHLPSTCTAATSTHHPRPQHTPIFVHRFSSFAFTPSSHISLIIPIIAFIIIPLPYHPLYTTPPSIPPITPFTLLLHHLALNETSATSSAPTLHHSLHATTTHIHHSPPPYRQYTIYTRTTTTLHTPSLNYPITISYFPKVCSCTHTPTTAFYNPTRSATGLQSIQHNFLQLHMLNATPLHSL